MSDIKVLIEIPEGPNVKYELDEETGEMTVDRSRRVGEEARNQRGASAGLRIDIELRAEPSNCTQSGPGRAGGGYAVLQ